MKRPKRLIRTRMNNLLSVITDFPLTIIEAPAGYGKTTAVQHFLSSRGLEPLWISFRFASEPSEYFWSKITDGVAHIDNTAGTAFKSLGFPDNTPQRNKIISLINKLELTTPTVVVLDNYELVANPLFSRLLLQIAEDEIENLHLVIITRDTTELDFVSLLSRGKCCVISQQQIKFTMNEVRDYCMLMSCTVTDSEMERMAKYTDGWISMIYIMLLGVEENIPIGINHTLDELIDKTLFNVHTAELQHFLLQLSLMDGFTARQAAFVTGNERAGELLKQLLKKNAFILYDNREKEYKIHNVLLDFLKGRQNFSTGERRDLYRRLGEWYLQRNDLFQAYSYLAQAGEVKKILEHLNTNAPIRNRYTDFEGADALFASAPKALLFENPIAYLRYLFYSIIKQKKNVMVDLTQRLDQLEQYYQNRIDISDKEKNHILAEILCVRKFTAFNRLSQMHAYNEQITRLLDGQHSSIMLQVNEFTFGSPHYLYIYFRDAGTLKELVALSAGNLSHAAFSDGCGTGSDSLAIAEYACETGDYHKALLESRKAVYKAETKSQWSVIICAEFNAMRASVALGKIHTALETLRQISADVEELNSAVYNSMIQLCKGYLYAVLEIPEKIPLWLKNGDLSSLSLFFGGMGFDLLVYGKVLLAQGEYLKIEALSASFADAFGVFHNCLGFIHNAILLAAARACFYGPEAGVTDLKKALLLARPDGIVLPFAECAVYLLPVFRVMPEADRQEQFTQHVRFCCEQYTGNLKGILPHRPKLTKRETEILVLLAGDLNRNEIADRLTISPATVKTHLQTIYRKLEADGKTSAVKIAQINGLI